MLFWLFALCMFLQDCKCSYRMSASICLWYWICWGLDSDMLMVVDLLFPATISSSIYQHVFFYIKSSQVKDMSAGQNNSWIISSRIHEDQDSKMPVFVFSVSPVSFTRHTVKENSIFKEVSCKYFLKSSTHANRCTAVWKTTRGLSLNSSCGNVWVGWGDANSATVSRHSADVHENDCPTS